MKNWMIPTILLVACVLTIQITNFNFTDANQPTLEDSAIQFVVKETADLKDVQRFGINLSSWNTWGAEEYAHNILFNPGFEAKVDRMLVLVSGTDKDSFYDVKGWGQKDGYWNGATFVVRTGESAGVQGTIVKSLEKGSEDRPEYEVAGTLPPLKEHDVILLMKNPDLNPIGNWWLPNPPQTLVLADPTQHRPGSTGVQSVVLTPTKKQTADLINFIDHLTERAGKLILVNGPWRLKFWAKAEGHKPNLQVEFLRLNQSGPFLTQSITPTSEWQEYVFDFNGKDNGEAKILMMKFSTIGENVKIWIDDAWLGPIQDGNDTSFRKEIAEMLKKFNPSFLRDWQGQASDSFENRIADQYARKDFIGRVAGNAPNEVYAYSLPAFLDLCEQIGANPWVIIPTVLLDHEYEQLGEFLAEHAHKNRFKHLYIEFGNENWNWIFKPAGIPFPQPHGLLAEKAFQHLQKGYGDRVNATKIVNGQHANPQLSLEYLRYAPSADMLSIAPYFFTSLDSAMPEEDILNQIFTPDEALTKQIAEGVKKLNKKLGVYEVNFHTTGGNASSLERDGYVAGMVSGPALAKHLLSNLWLHVEPQVIFSFSQFDTKVPEPNDYVRLWGITRDVSPTKRFRPTGLALMMLNQAIENNAHLMILQGSEKEGEKISATAFSTETEWTAAIVSSLPTATVIEIVFPEDQRTLPEKALILDATSIFDTNENSEDVKVVEKPLELNGRGVRLTVPAWGLVVLPRKKAI